MQPANRSHSAQTAQPFTDIQEKESASKRARSEETAHPRRQNRDCLTAPQFPRVPAVLRPNQTGAMLLNIIRFRAIFAPKKPYTHAGIFARAKKAPP